ncbi:MAG TPA: hypothetical protein VFQ88_10210 [Nevskiaceae bacterium]|nr:hypothetical protein [Nevskiaceae bacterium]
MKTVESPGSHKAVDTASDSPFRKGSEPAIPNRSKSQVGRPPVLGDAALVARVRRLSDELGRLPRAGELIAAAGGCQRQRALAAIRTVRVAQARVDLASALSLPPAIERHLRALAVEWLGLAAEQLVEPQAVRVARAEESVSALEAQIEERRAVERLLRQQVEDGQQVLDALTDRFEQLRRAHGALQARHASVVAVAQERKRLLAAHQADGLA